MNSNKFQFHHHGLQLKLSLNLIPWGALTRTTFLTRAPHPKQCTPLANLSMVSITALPMMFRSVHEERRKATGCFPQGVIRSTCSPSVTRKIARVEEHQSADLQFAQCFMRSRMYLFLCGNDRLGALF